MAHVRIGLIGCGRIARAVHLPVLEKLKGAQLVAIADSDLAARTAAATLAPGATVYANYQSLLESRTVDAVVICLPPQWHALSAVAAFDAGLHVYVEKPVATSSAEAGSMLDAWRKAGTIGMVGFNFRFHPQVVAARAALRQQAIGNVLAVRGSFTILPHELPAWKRDRAQGGGVLLDLASHHIDLVPYLLDDRVVRAWATHRDELVTSAASGHAAVQLTLASGVAVQLFVSLGSVEEHRVECFGDGGKLVIDRLELLAPERTAATLDGARRSRALRAVAALHPRRLLRSPGYEPSFGAALAAFVRAIGSSAFDGPDLLDGARCLAVVEAAERSATTGVAEVPEYPALHRLDR